VRRPIGYKGIVSLCPGNDLSFVYKQLTIEKLIIRYQHK